MKNHFSSTVNVFSYDGVAKYKKLASVESGSIFNVPLADVYSPPSEFYFQVKTNKIMDTVAFFTYSRVVRLWFIH